MQPKDHSVNLWNAKKSTDFLKYMKIEAFYACYMLSYAIQAINIGFVTGSDGDFKGRALLGRVDFFPCQVIFIIILVARIIDFCVSLSYIHRNDDNSSQKASPVRQLVNHVIKAIALVAVISIYFSKFTADDRLNADGSTHSYYSFAQRMWIVIEIASLSFDILQFVIAAVHWQFFNSADKAVTEVQPDPAATEDVSVQSQKIKLYMEKDGWDLSSVSPGFIENLPETHKFVMNKIDYKQRVHFGEDVFALTMMCLLKETVEKHKVVPEKQGQMIY